MSNKESEEESSEFLSSIVNTLAILAKEEVYGVLDTLAYVSDLSIVYSALYNAIRYLSTDENLRSKIPSENELNILFKIANKNPAVLRELAIRALARALKGGEQ